MRAPSAPCAAVRAVRVAAVTGGDTCARARAAQETGIAWAYDKEHLYGNYLPTNFNSDPKYRGGNTSTLPINQNEHLMVWLKPAAKPSFRKLWAIIHEPIPAGPAARAPARPCLFAIGCHDGRLLCMRTR